MTLPVQGLGEMVCDLAPEHISHARTAAATLSDAGFDVLITTARKHHGEWYTSERLFFAPLRKPPLNGAPAEDLIRALSEHEDVLAEIEKALGLAAEFDDHQQLSKDYPALTIRRDGKPLARLVVAASIGSTGPLLRSTAPVIVRLGFNAARLAVSEAEALERGDMVVLTHGPWPLIRNGDGLGSVLGGPGMPPFGLDPIKGTLVPVFPNSHSPLSNSLGEGTIGAMPTTENLTATEETPGLSVPVAIHLADTAITQAELERMAQTGTFDIGAVGEGLNAELSVAGRTIGRGEIVRIGDRFAVLLDHVQGASSTASTGDEQPVSEEKIETSPQTSQDAL